ncbi:MAG: aspartate/glutamate racemase family protein [Microbacterium sp.]
MRLLVVNPNSTARMTALIEGAVRATGAHDAVTVGPAKGPAAIETADDEKLAVRQVIALLDRHPELLSGADAVLLACYGDPGMAEVAAISPVPVFGIAQLSMGIAASLAPSFGLIVAKPSAVPIMSALAAGYGHALPEAAIEASGVPVLDLLDDPEGSYEAVRDAALRLKARGVDVVCLGCASMGQLAARLRADTGLIVIDAVQTSASALRGAAA